MYLSPDEDRLIKHLFHPDHQLHNPMTTPIANKNQTINVSVGIEILKFVALVSLNILRAYFLCLLMICIIFAGIFVLYRLQSADADICVLYCTVNNLLFFS